MESRCRDLLGGSVALAGETNQPRQNERDHKAVDKMVEQTDRESENRLGSRPQPEIEMQEIEREEDEEDEQSLQVGIP
jgi:hypothetical protein